MRMPRSPLATSRIGLFAALALLLSAASCPPKPPPPTPLAVAPNAKPLDRVLIISVDGLGPDVIRASEMPNLRALMARGAFTLSAFTTNTVKTLPSHTSMVTGVVPEKHGIDTNDKFRSYPQVPTLMEQVKRYRPALTTAIVLGKPKMQTLARPGGLDWVYVDPDQQVSDPTVEAKATEIIREHRPNVMMVHFPDVDERGHHDGWGSDVQRAAAARVDAGIGAILEALRAAGVLDQTVVIVSADHGGVGKSHKLSDGRSVRIPWVIAGPGVRAGVDLATVPGLEVHTEDTFATASWLLGLPMDANIDGKVQVAALALALAAPVRQTGTDATAPINPAR